MQNPSSDIIEDLVVRPYYEKKMITVPTGLIKLTRSSPPSREPVELVLGEKNGLQRRLVLIIGYKHFIVH